MSEQSSIRLADEKQRQQDDGAAEEGLSGDDDDNNAPQAALPISQLIFVVVALVLGIFMVCCHPKLSCWLLEHSRLNSLS